MERNQWRLFISYFSKWLLSVKITGLFQKALTNSANSVEPERKIWLQRDARVEQKVKNTCSTSRGQERNTEGEMPNERDQFCQWERYNATKKQTKGSKTKTPSHRKKMAKEIKGHTLSKRFFVL